MLQNSTAFLRKIRGPAQVVLVLISLYYVAKVLWSGLHDVGLSEISINPIPLGLALLLTVVCVFLGALQWWLLLQFSGMQISVRDGMRIHLLSIIPKYLPGYGWQYLGKVVLSEQVGAPRKIAIVCVLGEVSVTLIGGVLACLIVFPLANVSIIFSDNLTSLSVLWPSSAVLLLGLPKIVQIGVQTKVGQRLFVVGTTVKYSDVLLLIAIMILSWILFGFSLFLLSGSVKPIFAVEIPKYILALTLSFLVSLVAFFAPMGLGVREGVMTFLLSSWLPGPYPALVALLSRLVLVVAELLSFAVGTRL